MPSEQEVTSSKTGDKGKRWKKVIDSSRRRGTLTQLAGANEASGTDVITRGARGSNAHKPKGGGSGREGRNSPGAPTDQPLPDLLESEETDDSSLAAAFTLKLDSSDIFSKVMHDLLTKRVQHERERLAQQRERELALVAMWGRGKRRSTDGQPAGSNSDDATVSDNKDEDDDDGADDQDEDEEVSQEQRQAADAARRRRKAAAQGWALIRRHIREKAMARKHTDAAMTWSFLRQTISNMSDMEKARRDMYDKYLNNPSSWMQGLSNVPKEVLDKLGEMATARSRGIAGTFGASSRAGSPRKTNAHHGVRSSGSRGLHVAR